ncbi:MAG: hypothetical protein R3E62_07420 [Pseudomonadales bacterium]|jgi:hypothetical protein
MLKKRIMQAFAKAERATAPTPERKGWIGVDLDGTLARYDGWYGPAHIGEPIPAMLERVKNWLNEGVEVRIFTARASVPEYIPFVTQWLEKQGLPALEVTNVKDFAMISLWDDRCVQVETNLGEPKFP